MENEMNVKLGLDTKKYNEKIGEALSSYDTFVRTVNQNPAKFHFNTDSLKEINKVFKDIRKSAFNELNAISKQLNKISIQKMSINLDNSGVIASMDKIKDQYGELEKEARKYQSIIEQNEKLGSVQSFDQARNSNVNFLKSEGMSTDDVKSKTGFFSIDISSAAVELATKKLKEAQQNMALLDQDAEKLNSILENNDLKLEKLSKAAEPLQASFETLISDLQANPLDENFDSSILQQFNGEIDNVNDGLGRTGEKLDEVDEKTNKVARTSGRLNLMGRMMSQMRNTIAAALNPLNMFRKLWNKIIMTDDSKFGNTFKTIAANIQTALTPAFEKIAQWIINLIGYFNVLLKAFSGGKIDLFAKTSKSAKSTAKSAAEINKQTAGFDEINDISESGGGSGGGGDSIGPIAEPELNGDWVKTLTEWGEKLREFWDKAKEVFGWIKDNVGTWGLVALGILGVVAALTVLNKITGGIAGPLIGIGVALAGLAATLLAISVIMKTMEETGTSIGDLALTMIAILAPLAVAVIAFAVAAKMIDVKGLAGLVVIFVGLSAVLLIIKDLLVTMTENGISATDMLATMGVVVGSIIVLVAALTAAAMILGSNPLALVAVVALAASLVAILLVMEKVVPVILNALASFFERVGPIMVEILDKVLQIIDRILDTVDNLINNLLKPVLVPLINNIGNFLKGLIDTIGKLISKMGEFFNSIKNKIVDVFTKGGEIFKGIRDGFLDIVKTIVNGIISGANTVIALPFKGLNKVLNFIRNIHFLGISPFKGLWKQDPIPVPQIPKLNVGTEYVPQDMLAMIHKGEAVIPKEFNDKSYFSGNNNEETNRLLYEVIDAIQNIEINPYTTVKDVGNASIQYIKDKSRQLGRSVI